MQAVENKGAQFAAFCSVCSEGCIKRRVSGAIRARNAGRLPLRYTRKSAEVIEKKWIREAPLRIKSVEVIESKEDRGGGRSKRVGQEQRLERRTIAQVSAGFAMAVSNHK